MKKNKLLVVILLVLITLSSGCTKYLKNGKNRIINETTGQNVTSNILCLPEDEKLLNIYEENKEAMDVDYSSLKPCAKFSPRDIKYQSIWESIFVKPLAWIIIKVGIIVKNYGLAVMILGILIRLVLLPFSKKSLVQSENMKKAQPEIQAIQKKYEKNSSDQSQAMQMSQELMMVYKKYDINPASGCLISFIQLPILLAFYEAINRVPAIFEENLLSLQLGTSPMIGIKNGNLLYLVLVVLIALTTYYSYKYSMSTSTGNAEQDKQTKMMMMFMIAFISFASISLPTALALYWIVSNGFMIVQNFIVKSNLKKLKSNGKVVNNKKNSKKKGK